ncbi:hypothetical protein KIH86_05950 [Paenibacillus sp. HN-1]|uniref:DUF6199 family natural product biosynthesis protein n=1 Tax=Paenibacillus TaxID=44249 RepID=UPI001CA8038A|nr:MULTISPECIES: DUF6199 family natural product biosynthesis protein [Paenibacillus]MBY9078037.1 hypothetical protein [Paenibacillus sp. CGMCC 1.18879]MBY9083778.1 hypothetical protein [Paenibacillus sinensis]
MSSQTNWVSIAFTAFIVLWTFTAIFATIKPRLFWKITQGWKATREPSRAYFVLSAIGTGIFSLIGLTLLLLPYFHP